MIGLLQLYVTKQTLPLKTWISDRNGSLHLTENKHPFVIRIVHQCLIYYGIISLRSLFSSNTNLGSGPFSLCRSIGFNIVRPFDVVIRESTTYIQLGVP